MNKIIVNGIIQNLLNEYAETFADPGLWRDPIVKFVDANHPEIPKLKDLVCPTHYLPTDFLNNPTIIITYFLPFSIAAVNSNADGYYASTLWIAAYTHSENAIVFIDNGLIKELTAMGYSAVKPQSTGYINDTTYLSRWSHRHIARLGGMGTFGAHNLLITDRGCGGYCSSVITKLSVTPDPMLLEERCLYKKNGSCGACFSKCICGALSPGHFDRNKCHAMTEQTKAYYANQKTVFVRAADGCGKCAAGVPCSIKSPS